MKPIGFALVLALTGLAAPDWQKLAPAEFDQRPEIQALIDSSNFDGPLMVAAVFHETNRVRRQLGLDPFTHLPKLDDAAELKVAIGVLQGGLSHENPMPLNATPADRVRSVGLHYRQVAENIGRLGVSDLSTGSAPEGMRQPDDLENYSHLRSKRTVALRTYAGFAAAMVKAWMDSPPHRANIVNPEFQSLGCAARVCRDLTTRREQVYVAQVFFTPR